LFGIIRYDSGAVSSATASNRQETNMRVRKQVYELTVEDFLEHSVWEFALEEEGEQGQDEATVRPKPVVGPVDPAEGMVVLKARFTLADGTLMAGYVTPPSPYSSGLGTIQPQIITKHGQVPFWCAASKPTREALVENYGRLGRAADEVFPVRFSSEVEVVGGPVTGILNGFLYFAMETETTHEIL
jgi:hypothetical protein